MITSSAVMVLLFLALSADKKKPPQNAGVLKTLRECVLVSTP